MIKSKLCKVRKKWVFSKGKVFSVKKSKIFPIVFFFFKKTDLEIILSFGRKRNKAFQNSKNVNFVKSKKWVFCKGVNASFRSKNPKFLQACFLVQ